MRKLQFHIALFALLIGNFDNLSLNKHLRKRDIKRNQSRFDRRHLVAEHVDNHRILIRRGLAGSAFGKRRLNGVFCRIRTHETETVHDHRTLRCIRSLALHIGYKNIAFRTRHRFAVIGKKRFQTLDDRLFAATGKTGCDLLFLNFSFCGICGHRGFLLLRTERNHSSQNRRCQCRRIESGIFCG